jgi:Sigma 54 modulation/S30EA ribosomal protein C terminus
MEESRLVNNSLQPTVDAWKAKVKGIMVYHYGSREGQVLSYVAPEPVLAPADTGFSGGCIGGPANSEGPLHAVTFGPGPHADPRRSKRGMRHRTELPPVIEVDVTTRGELPGAADYARSKIGELGRLAHRPVLHARVKVTRHGDPAVERPVVAQANLDVDGRLFRAQVEGVTAREAVDRLQARLRRRLERAAEHWEARRGKLPAAGPHEWRHESEPTHRPSYFPRPADERRIIRRKSFAMAPCTVDEAALEMELLDYDFHLFTEKGSATAGVLYRGGPTGYRLALVAPAPADQLSPFELPVTIDPQSAPCLTVEHATERLGLLGLTFLFFIDAAQGRASVLYHRYDGHYGLITPAG